MLNFLRRLYQPYLWSINIANNFIIDLGELIHELVFANVNNKRGRIGYIDILDEHFILTITQIYKAHIIWPFMKICVCVIQKF